MKLFTPVNKQESEVQKLNTVRVKVESVDHLKKLLADGEIHDFVFILNYGLRSSKELRLLSRGRLWISNLIDSSVQTLYFSQLNDTGKTNIGKAITEGAFYMEKAELI